MNNYSKIYWLTRLDNIQAFFTTAFAISLIILLVYHLIMLYLSFDSDVKEYNRNWSKYRNISLWVGLISGIFLVFIPTKNDMILIYAGGKTMDFVQSDTSLSKIPYQTTSIISEYLDRSIKEVKDKEQTKQKQCRN